MASPASRIAVLGAGITGLTAAHRLTQRGHRVRVFETAARTGGVIQSHAVDGWLIEAGPNSLQQDSSVAALIDELGLRDECVAAGPHARNRFIVRRGEPIPVPLSPPALLTSRLFSVRAKLAILLELLSRRRTRTSDLSLAEFAGAHFGREVVDYALNPFVTGVYAGNPGRLSARHAFPKLWQAEQQHGSLLRAQVAAAKASGGRPMAPIVSFRRGLQTLPDALAARLPSGALALNARLEALLPANGWSVVWNDGASTHTETFDRVIAALPAPALAQLRVGPLGERPLASLDAIEHPPLSSVFLGYQREQVRHALDGFGLLVPEVERRSFLGVLFSSTLFSERAPADHVALTVLVGGVRDPGLARLPTEALLSRIASDLAALLGVAGEPVFRHHSFWPRAIPQYNLGFEAHLATMAAAERNHPGLHLVGQARDGISLPACIAAGERLAARLSAA